MDQRHYGLDWLRIGAFGLLIFYHIGMVFVPWDFHIKTAHPMDWVQWPMLLLNPWRLGLLFLISGVASRHLLGKLRSPGAFVASRSARLLIPLAAGMALWVAPQPWVELTEKAGYTASFAHFWTRDYFVFGSSFAAYKSGFILPTWNHLWFVVYLWVYTLVAAALAWALGRRGQAVFDRLFGGWRLYALPLAWEFATRVWLYPRFGETHGLLDDPYAHAAYLPLFLFGMGLARSPALLARAAAAWRPLLLAALAAYGARMAYNLSFPDGDPDAPEWITLCAQAARAVDVWATILGLIGLATAHLQRDSAARRWLTRAVFPFYIAHQTIIIVVEHWVKPFALGAAGEFAVLLSVTVLGCLAFAWVGERAGMFRPLFGLTARSRSRSTRAPSAVMA